MGILPTLKRFYTYMLVDIDQIAVLITIETVEDIMAKTERKSALPRGLTLTAITRIHILDTATQTKLESRLGSEVIVESEQSHAAQATNGTVICLRKGVADNHSRTDTQCQLIALETPKHLDIGQPERTSMGLLLATNARSVPIRLGSEVQTEVQSVTARVTLEGGTDTQQCCIAEAAANNVATDLTGVIPTDPDLPLRQSQQADTHHGINDGAPLDIRDALITGAAIFDQLLDLLFVLSDRSRDRLEVLAKLLGVQSELLQLTLQGLESIELTLANSRNGTPNAVVLVAGIGGTKTLVEVHIARLLIELDDIDFELLVDVVDALLDLAQRGELLTVRTKVALLTAHALLEKITQSRDLIGIVLSHSPCGSHD